MKKRARRRRGPAAADETIRFYPNDPDAGVGPIDVPPPSPVRGEPPYVIEGRRYAPAPYAPGTFAFQQWQGEASLARTIRVWEEFLDRDFDAWSSGRPLRVRLRAGRDLNAFYDRKSLQFFYDTDRVTGRPVYAAESLDIVAHEAGHAILDVYQPGYWSLPDAETAAFHEAFADCSAILVTLGEPSVRLAFLEEASRALRASNLVSKLAEALGRAIYDNYGPGSLADPTRLRDANNRFRYAAPETLPASGADDALSSEPHSFSRVFTGAFYHLLTELLAAGLRESKGPETVDVARRRAGRLLARAVETSPPGEARVAAYAGRMLEIDAAETGGAAAAAIRRAFARHGVRLPRGVKGRERYAALRALDPDRPGGAAALRAALGLSGGERLEHTAWKARVGGGVREQLVHRHRVEAHPSSSARARAPKIKIVVEVVCGCTLTRSPRGDVEGMTLIPRRDPTPAEVARWLRPWLRRGAIAWGDEAAKSASSLFRGRKVFRVGAGGLLERVYAD
ncbi:MAG TPA: hypothetical protein VFS09_08090 [Candidatus Eisenbacteria bacterium]|nr:hypothetical protein [Candidatus Eisenbacteria bacterium]